MPRQIIAPRWLAPIGAGAGTPLSGQAVVVHLGAIEAVLPLPDARTRWPDVPVTELPQHLLIPGLVNARTRIAAHGLRPLTGPGPGFDAAVLAISAMLSAGVTTFVDAGLQPEETLQAARAFGMRVVVALPVAERATGWAGGAGDHLSKGLALREHWRDDPLASFVLQPCEPTALSDATLAAIASLAAEIGLPVHADLHGDRAALGRAIERHGRRPLARFEQHGLLGPDFVAAGALHLDGFDLDCLAGHDIAVVHCPTHELRTGQGIFDADTLRARGIRLALGGGADAPPQCDLLAEARLSRLLARGSSGRIPDRDGQDALRMATRGGAEALGLDHLIGSITVGRRADLVAIELPADRESSDEDPLEQLLWGPVQTRASHVWIDGRLVVSARQPTDPSAASLSAEVVARSRLWHNRSGEFIG